MFFYQNPLKWVKNLEISASSAWDPAGLMLGEAMAVSENQETIVANAGIGYQDGGKLGFLVVLEKNAEGTYEQTQIIRSSGLSVYGTDNFGSMNVLMSKNGNTIVTGTPDPEPNWDSWNVENAEDYGFILIFQSGSTGWTQTQVINRHEDIPYMSLLWPLAISDNGNRLFAVNKGWTEDSVGKIYIYEKNVSGSFELQQQIEPTNGVSFQATYGPSQFILLEDMTTFFISNQNVSGSFSQQGAVYIYSSGSNGYELTDTIIDQDEIGDNGRFGAEISYSSQNNLLAVKKYQTDSTGAALLYQSGSNGFQKVQTIENFADETLNSGYLTEDGTTLLTTVYKKINNPKGKRTIRFYQSGSSGFQPTGVELETNDTYTNWDSFAFPNYRLDYDKPAGRIIATAHGYDVAGVGSQVGAIYVFDSGSSGWQQSQLITASDDWNPSADNFGVHLGASNDGEHIFVLQSNQANVSINGTTYNENIKDGDSVNGSLYIFKKDGESYRQTQRIVDPAPVFSNWEIFGGWYGFGINDEGTRIVITDQYRDNVVDNVVSYHGVAYIYDSGSNGFSLTQEVEYTPLSSSLGFGYTARLSSTGQKLFISNVTGSAAINGRIVIFNSGSNGFQQVQEIEQNDPDGNIDMDYFAWNAMEISKDETVLLVGTYGDEENGVEGVGAIYVFVSGSTGYQQTQKLDMDGTSFTGFGLENTYCISEDNSRIFASARGVKHNNNSNHTGIVKIYESGSNGYQEIQTLIAPSGEVLAKNFGHRIAISGSYLAVTSTEDTTRAEQYLNSGNVYIYQKVNGVYELMQRIAQEGNTNTIGVLPFLRMGFGNSIKFLSTNEILIGSPFDDKNGVNSGIVYRYKLTRDY